MANRRMGGAGWCVRRAGGGLPGCNRRRRGFTLIELLVVVAIIAMLIAILLPSLRQARDTATMIVCLSNQRQLAMAHTNYAVENSRKYVRLHINGTPPADAVVPDYGPIVWTDLLSPQLGGSKAVFSCPSVEPVSPGRAALGIGLNHIGMSYAWDPAITAEISMSSVVRPSASVVFGDAGRVHNFDEADPDKWMEESGVAYKFFFLTPDHPHFHSAPTGPGFQRRVVNRHVGRAAAGFADGHGEALPVSEMGFQYWGPTAEGGATGDPIIGGGNGKYDGRWMWDRQ
jgi:prepilin-type N-terminal cleavage/methylation domain-containing protein/prepilin-type processing-associated H-X9-DG protein